MENKNYKRLMWLLIILVFGLIVLVVYKGFFAETKSNETSKTTTTITTAKEEKKTLSDEELEKYLSYVPLSYIYDGDAYSGNKVSLDNINEKILLEQIYYKTIKEDGSIEMEHEMCGDIQPCETENYVLVEEFEKVAKSMYGNPDLSIEEFKIAGGTVKKSDIYYGAFYGSGAVALEKVNKVKKYEIIGKQLVIYEKIGILENNIGELNVYKYHGYNTFYKSINTTEMSKEQYDKTLNELKIEIQNSDEFPIYKHIFKQHEDGTYYWYSTEVVEN